MAKLVKIINYILVFFLVINFIYTLSGVFHFSLRSIDVYSIWMLKAKAFWVENGFPLKLLSTVDYSHPHYPIFLPYIFYSIFRFVGDFKEIYVLIFYPILYVLILIFSYITFLKINIPKIFALLLVYIYSMFSPILSQAGRNHAGTADIVITLFNWIFVILIIKYFAGGQNPSHFRQSLRRNSTEVLLSGVKKEKQKIFIYLLILIIWISSQIKQEGVFLALSFIFLPLTLKKKCLFTFISITPTIIWHFVLIKLNIHSDYSILNFNKDIILELMRVFALIVREMANVRNWYIFWLIFWIVNLSEKISDIRIQALNKILISLCLCFGLIYVTTSLDTVKQASSSLDRVMMQLSPFYYTIFAYKIWMIVNRYFPWAIKKH